jgi:AcrR family transcriptional regulator
MATTPKGMDRRVQRTQQLLKQAFLEVAQEKGFAAMSIQDVTDRANVNRGTFYAHFPDKYALLETILYEDMQRTVIDSLPSVSQWDRNTLQLFIRTVLDYFDDRYGQCHLTDSVAPLFQRAAREAMAGLLLEWLKRNGAIRPQVSLAMLADMMSWTIFGAAAQRCHNETKISADEMACTILRVMMEGIERLAMESQESGHSS